MNFTIRAHHLFCTTEFTGHGYTEGFASHMEKIVNLLHSGENHTVTLAAHPDVICSECPNLELPGTAGSTSGRRSVQDPVQSSQAHNCEHSEPAAQTENASTWNYLPPCDYRRGRCSSDGNRVVSMDLAVLRELHLQDGQPYAFSDLLSLLSQVGENTFQRVCGNCSWKKAGLCSLELLKRNAKVYLLTIFPSSKSSDG